MITDLAAQEADAAVDTDVLIVGSGVAGLLLAAELRHRRVRTVVLESGAREQADDVHPFNRVVQQGDRYRGASLGRFRCLGGTSTRWGGALIPFLDQDLADRPHIGIAPWPIETAALRPYLARVEALFGIDGGSYDEDYVRAAGAERQVPTGDADFVARFAKWPVFKRRNLATLFKDAIERDPGLSVWINATATRFDLDQSSGRIGTVTARHPGGRSVTVAARQIAVCAGAIESTRLLLLLDRQYDGRVFAGCDALGRFFHDHVSARMARIKAKQPVRLNRMAGFRFAGTTMRSLRFEFSPTAQARERVASAFGHISVEADDSAGYEALRLFLRSLQQTGRIRPDLARRLLADIPYLAKAGYWRYARRQLYWPGAAKYELHVVVEQAPKRDNRIGLAGENDPFGLPLAAISWRIGQPECDTFAAYLRRFDAFWKRRELAAIGELEWSVRPDALSIADIAHGGDVFHPGGSTRMGVDGRSAVVDPELRTHALSNLWVASTSVFPSTASANPTLTLILLTLRLADHLGILLGKA